MFTRVVAVRTKPGKARDLSKTIHDKILPILEDQPGFVDEILLVSDTEPDKILALSFWESQQDAERYTTAGFWNAPFTVCRIAFRPLSTRSAAGGSPAASRLLESGRSISENLFCAAASGMPACFERIQKYSKPERCWVMSTPGIVHKTAD